jgi:hypothetical protein
MANDGFIATKWRGKIWFRKNNKKSVQLRAAEVKAK